MPIQMPPQAQPQASQSTMQAFPLSGQGGAHPMPPSGWNWTLGMGNPMLQQSPSQTPMQQTAPKSGLGMPNMPQQDMGQQANNPYVRIFGSPSQPNSVNPQQQPISGAY
jgi:hypothetical protein